MPNQTKLSGLRPAIEQVLEQRPTYLLGLISNRLVAASSAICRRHFEIGFMEWRIVVVVNLEPATAKRISDVVGLDKGAVSRGIVVLEERGLIRPTEETRDRRSKAYVLTDAGRQMHGRMLKASLELERRLLADLQPHEVAVMIQLLQRVLAQTSELDAYQPEAL